jgi:hypothetical protein
LQWQNKKLKTPQWNVISEAAGDPAVLANNEMFSDAVQEQATQERNTAREQQAQYPEDAPLPSPEEERRNRLPIALQFAMKQMSRNVQHAQAIPKHVVLRDWLQVTY